MWSGERCGTCCWAASRASSTSWWRGRDAAAARRLGGDVRNARALRDRDACSAGELRGRPRRAHARETYAQPGRAARREPGGAGGGPRAPRLHRQRDGDAACATARCAASPGALEDLEARRPARPARRVASPTTRRGCGGWRATPRGSGSRSRSGPGRWPQRGRRRRRRGDAPRQRAAPRPGRAATRPPRCAALAGLDAARAARRLRRPAGPASPTRSRCCPPARAARDLVTLAACVARDRSRARCWPGSTSWASRPRERDPSSPRRRARARRRRCARRRPPAGDRAARRGARRSRPWRSRAREQRARAGSPSCATCGWRSPATTCWRRACPRARRSASGCAASLDRKLDGERDAGRDEQHAPAGARNCGRQ